MNYYEIINRHIADAFMSGVDVDTATEEAVKAITEELDSEYLYGQLADYIKNAVQLAGLMLEGM